MVKYGAGHGGVSLPGGDLKSDQGSGSFFILVEQQAVELRFEVGASGIDKIDLSSSAADAEDFVKGLVALVVDETELGNLHSARKVAGLLADYYSQDVLVLDAQMHQGDTLVGEMHFVEGATLEARRTRALDVLTECARPSSCQVLH